MKTKSCIAKPVLLACLFICCTIIASAQYATDYTKIKKLIAKNVKSLGWVEHDLSEYRVSYSYNDALSNMLLVYLQQTYKGYDVNRAIQTVTIKNDSLNYIAGKRFNTHAAALNTYQGKAAVTATDAVKVSLQYLHLPASALLIPINSDEHATEITFVKTAFVQNNITAKLLWQPDELNNTLLLCWQIQIQPAGSNDLWLINADAISAHILGKENLTIKCAWDACNTMPGCVTGFLPGNNSQDCYGLLSANVINSAVYNVIKFPAASLSHTGGKPTLDTNPWEHIPNGNGANPFNWNEDNLQSYNSTQGNNVLAQEDVKGTNYDGSSAKSSTLLPNLTFNFAFDSTKEPTDSSNQRFAITNLFYWNNIMHDISYLYGFNEAAGNFQQSNNGKPGLGNDFVYADAQDGSSANSASFIITPDGTSPRMQLGLFNGLSKRDASLDNEVICHEYTHGITNRIVGGPSSVTCLQNDEQMGEGWSDYFALMVTTNWATAQPGDGIKKRSIATYSLGQTPDGPGVRIHPYSTDMGIDPWTYADLPNVPAPGGYPDAHAVGEIWCSVLWDITWALINEEGISTDIYNTSGTGGNIIAMKLVNTALKLTPCSPGFLDAKKALIQADNVLFGQKYDCIIKESFARRGMGAYFAQGSSLSYKDGTADFSEPFSARVYIKANDDTATEGSQLTYSLNAKGGACGGIGHYKITDTLPPELSYNSGGTYDETTNTVSFNNIELGNYGTDTLYLTAIVKGGTYYPPVEHIVESVPEPYISDKWVTYNIAGANTFTANERPYSVPYAFFVYDAAKNSVSVLETKDSFLLTGKSTLSFWNNYTTETLYDGGVVEISTDNGATWADLADYFIQNGYDTTISAQYGSYLANRRAFTGKSNGYIQSVADLTTFKGLYVKIRFIFATDNGGASYGWNIDDIVFKSEAAIDNKSSIFNNSGNFVFASHSITLLAPGVLSEKWGLFTAQKNNNNAVLQWHFLQPSNTAEFIVERSSDAIHFIAIGTVKAAANAGDYSFTDHHPLQALNYYRIKQVGSNAHVDYSLIKQLNFTTVVNILVSPNPATDLLFININGNIQTGGTATLYSITGHVFNTYNFNGNTSVLHLPKLAPGIYFLKITGTSFTTTRKIIIE
ncbi:MAG TPA: M36 family metallopeptidase [Panacibacter sp.]|nr:M36 family metallopeptidase [Panacibacter sp.]